MKRFNRKLLNKVQKETKRLSPAVRRALSIVMALMMVITIAVPAVMAFNTLAPAVAGASDCEHHVCSVESGCTPIFPMITTGGGHIHSADCYAQQAGYMRTVPGYDAYGYRVYV